LPPMKIPTIMGLIEGLPAEVVCFKP